jgi:iron complex transport system ATP-binding protein
MFRVENIHYARSGKHILRSVSCDIRSGCFTVILGPNGAGKSTLMRLLSGEVAPDSGQIVFDGRPLPQWEPLELARRRAVLAQESHLRFAFTVLDVVLMGRLPHITSVETPLDRRIALDALHSMDLDGLESRSFPTLSGGEKQRVHLARVWTQIQSGDQPDFQGRCLLLDEPTNNLDLHHQIFTLDKARALADAGAAVVAVLHDLNLAARYADEALLLKDGEMCACGSTCEVLKPETIDPVFRIQSSWMPAENGFAAMLRIR